MVVHAGPEEADLRVGVRIPLRELGEMIEALGLGEPVGQVQIAIEPHLRRDLLEQLVHRLRADDVEHRLAIGIGG
jgi:hypothetical protein